MINWILWLALAAGVPAVAAEPVSVKGVLYVRPFTLEAPYKWTWSAEGGVITEGLLAAVLVDPTLALPRDVGQRVLYAGQHPVERMNPGWPSGCLFVIIPGHPDLSATPLYFGGDELPERIDQAAGEAALQEAQAAGVAPMPAVSIELLSLPAVTVPEIRDVYRMAAERIPDCAPEDQSWADTWRL